MAAQGPSLETVLGEAFRVGAQVVLSSRVWSQARRQPEQALPKRKAWFNLELEELESANWSLEPWRKDVGRPLVLEVFLQPWGGEPQASPQGQLQAPAETLLEQWVFHYQPQLPHGHALTRSQVSRLNPTSIYKRLIIMLRSLFCYVRVLPAYRMYRDCKRQESSNFSIGYRVSGTLPRRAAPASPPASGGSSSGARSASASSSRRSLQQFDFAPVDTPYGQFKVSVAYQPSSRVALLQQATSPPPLPQLMAEYGAGGGSGAGRAAAAGQLPLRHAMSAQVLLPAAAAVPSEPGAVPQAPQRRATVGAVPVSPSGSSGSSGGGSLRRQSSALNPLRNPAWSSMRLSPNLLGGVAYSPHPQASPFAAAPMPYGSAPQLAHSPQLLRALSLQTASSSSPCSKPPRPPQRGATALESGSPATPLGARLISQAQHRSACLYSGRQQQFEGEGEEEGSEGAAGSSARQSSAPVSIPGCSQGRTRRLRSSGDLWGMHQPADVQKPLSAPAVSHLPSPGPQPESQGTGGTGSQTTDASLPQGPPLLPIVGPESESSESAASSALFPNSCSPQLPFAFTPSAQSLTSYGSKGPMQESVRLERTSPHMRRTSSGAGASPAAAAASTSWPFQGRGLGFSPQQHQYQQHPGTQQAQQAGAAQQQQGSSPLASGRASGDGPAAAAAAAEAEREAQQAIVRHTSWSSQSSSQQQQQQQHKSLGRGGGYSVSPLQDPLMDSVLGTSTPRTYVSGVSAGRGPSRASSSGGSGGGGGRPPPLLTYPSTAPARSRGGEFVGGAEVSPFGARAVSAPAGGFGSPAVMLHGSGSALAPSPSAPPAAAAAGAVHASAAGVAAAGLGASSSDAAVAAFVRLLGEAPPLRFDGGGGGADDAAGAAWEEGAGGGEASGGGPGGRLTLETALRQFGLISQRLHSRGVISSVEA